MTARTDTTTAPAPEVAPPTAPDGAPRETPPLGVRRVAEPGLDAAVVSSAEHGEQRTRWRAILRWSLCALFAVAGASKLFALPMMVESFRGWGYPVGMLYAVGGAEVAVALLLGLGKLRFGASAVCVVMVGAALTHLQAQEWLALVVPVVVIVAAGALIQVSGPRPASSEMETASS